MSQVTCSQCPQWGTCAQQHQTPGPAVPGTNTNTGTPSILLDAPKFWTSLPSKIRCAQSSLLKNNVCHISEKNFSTKIAPHLDGVILRVLFTLFSSLFSTCPLLRKLEIIYHCYFIISSSTCEDFSNYFIIKFDILLFYFVL